MRVTFIEALHTAKTTYHAGETHDLDDAEARRLIAAYVVRPAENMASETRVGNRRVVMEARTGKPIETI